MTNHTRIVYGKYMTGNQLLEKLHRVRPQTIGKEPVVVLPLDYYNRMREDLEMFHSKALVNKIAKARKARRIFSSAEAKKLLLS